MNEDTLIRRKYISVRQRCHNPNSSGYHKYGAKGIKMHQEWLENYESFKKWAYDSGFKAGLTIDRIDNSKGYSPENCRWATIQEQANNKTNNVLIEYKGDSMTLKQWCDHLNLNYKRIFARYQRGIRPPKLFTKSKLKNSNKKPSMYFTFNGETKSCTEWSEHLGINPSTIYLRYQKGLSVEEILSPKPLLVERDKTKIKNNGDIKDDLKKGRIEKGLTMKELSSKLGYVSNQVWRWENTDRRIKKEDINKLIELGILNGSKWNKEDE